MELYIWLFSNEMGRLCQGSGKSADNTEQHVQGTNTFFAIKYNNIPADRQAKVRYTQVVCEYQTGHACVVCTICSMALHYHQGICA